MNTKNLLYLFLTGGFLVLVLLSSYWFEQSEKTDDYYDAQDNPVVTGSIEAWKVFNSTLSYLDILGADVQKDPKPFWENHFKNPLRRGVDIAGTFETKEVTEIAKEVLDKSDFDKSVKEVVQNTSGEDWFKNSSAWLSKQGLYYLKTSQGVELGWQSSQGKTYSFTVPY